MVRVRGLDPLPGTPIGMSTEPSETDRDRRICSPCRGSGKVISNLGGERREITCPWCEGSGEFKSEHDAQGLSEPASTAEGDEPSAAS
jgi:DnaJ-class molecular chaperone